MELDEILKKYVGDIGLYQVLIVGYISSIAIHAAFNVIDYNFIGAVPEFHCDVGNISHLTSNLTNEQVRLLTSPLSDDNLNKVDTCSVYVRNYSQMSIDEAHLSIKSVNRTDSVTQCDRWVFDEEMGSTVASEWSLVCDREWLIATSQSVLMVGTCTVFLGGLFADRFGRRLLVLLMLGLHIVARLACSLSVNYYMFVSARFFMSAATVNWYTGVFVIAIEMVIPKYRVSVSLLPYYFWSITIEMVTPKYRVSVSLLPYYFWSIGYMILAGMAYLIRDWRILTASLLAFVLPHMLLICFLPESIRWLQAKGRTEQAMQQVRKMSRLSKKSLPDDVTMSKKCQDTDPHSGMCDLFKSVKLVKITLVLIFCWNTINIVYYGLIFYLPKLGGNVYISTVISGALEIPALMYTQFALDTRLGRRLNTSGSFILSGVALLTLMAVPKDYNWVILSLTLFGRFAITVTYATLYLYIPELYPTLHRSAGLTLCSFLSRMGSIASPYIAILGKVSPYLPPSIFGSLALAAGLLTLLLPETRGITLPTTVTQVGANNRSSPTDESEKEKEPLDNTKI